MVYLESCILSVYCYCAKPRLPVLQEGWINLAMALPVKDFEDYSVTSQHYDSSKGSVVVMV